MKSDETINRILDAGEKPTNWFELAKSICVDPYRQPPYPWCPGNPTVKDCVDRGYCSKDPNCGE